MSYYVGGSLAYMIVLGLYYIDFLYWFLLGVDSEILETIVFLQIIVIKLYSPVLLSHILLILAMVGVLQFLSGFHAQEKISFLCMLILLEGLRGSEYLQFGLKNSVDVYSFDKIYFLKWGLLVFYLVMLRIFVYYTVFLGGLLIVSSILDLTIFFKLLSHYKKLLMKLC